MVPGEYGPGEGFTLPYPQYWHLVVATEAGGTHPTGMYYNTKEDFTIERLKFEEILLNFI